MTEDFLSPLLLAADGFTLGVNGSAAVNPGQLINPNREAMLVDEFRFSFLDGTDDGNGTGVDMTSVLINLTFGATPLTNGFIPVRSFMPIYSQYPYDGTIAWRLARPLYVPPDVQIGAFFQRKLPFTSWNGGTPGINTTTPFGFSIAGRSMPAGMEIPKKIYVPWACATSVYSEVVPFISGDADLSNPFDVPLNVDYLTGFQQNEDAVVIPTPVTFQATLSNGKVLARDPIPFFALFQPDRPTVRMRALLQPKEFISVVLDLPQPTEEDTNIIFTTVGLTGWREMQTPQGALP